MDFINLALDIECFLNNFGKIKKKLLWGKHRRGWVSNQLLHSSRPSRPRVTAPWLANKTLANISLE